MKAQQFFFYLSAFVGIFVIGCLMSLMNDMLSPMFHVSQWRHINNETESVGSFPNQTLLRYEEEEVTANDLFRRVRVLCFVLTMPSAHKTKAKAVKETWGRRCQRLLFISTQEEESIGAIAINITEDRNHLWEKTKEGYKYAWENYQNETDWFLKADDDTYMVMENLRYLLGHHNPDDPLWFGHRFKKFSKHGYMSGGAGYVLSREAVRRLVEIAIPNPKICRIDAGGAEDAELGKCLDKVGVVPLDSRDVNGRERFHPFIPEHHLVPGALGDLPWYWEYAYYLPKMGFGCCSDTPISFHYITPQRMYVFEYFIYQLRLFGVSSPRLPFPPSSPANKSNGTPIFITEDMLAKMKADKRIKPENITVTYKLE